MPLYAGLDWAAAEHAVCVIDERGTVVEHLTVPHTADGLGALLRRLEELSPDLPIQVAIERPSGLVVDTLVHGRVTVVPIHPNVVMACRSRYKSPKSKSDRGDAYLLADLLRTDGHRFQALRPASDEIRALRAKTRTREDLLATRIRLTNQLRSLLDGFWPGPVAMFRELDSLIALEFLARYPSPRDIKRLTEKRLAAFLVMHAYRGRTTAAEFLERMKGAPTGRNGEAEEEAKRALVVTLVGILRNIVDQLAKLTKAIEHDTAQLPVGRMMMSFPHGGQLNAGLIVAELGDDPSRYVSADHLAAEVGACPITRASGKHHAVHYRHACNKRLRHALTLWAYNSRNGSEWASRMYARARERGCSHAHALRILTRAWCRVLWRVWQSGTTYDPKQHAAAVALTEKPAAMPA